MFYIAGNWKMHKNRAETAQYISELNESISFQENKQAIFFPSYSALTIFENADMNSQVSYGAQNCHWEKQGAYTGELSVEQLTDYKVSYVLVGHSERRHEFGEHNANMIKKINAISEKNLTPVLCIGETREQRDAQQTNEILKSQLIDILAVEPLNVLVAYEPVWAIGTGLVASVEDIESAHSFIRSLFVESWGKEKGGTVPILYGGSVKPENCQQIGQIKDVSGFLIGGASLKVESFKSIYESKFS